MNWIKRIFGLERQPPRDAGADWGEIGEGEVLVLQRFDSPAREAPAHPHFRSMAGLFEDARSDGFGGDAGLAARAFLPAQPVSTVSRFAGRHSVPQAASQKEKMKPRFFPACSGALL